MVNHAGPILLTNATLPIGPIIKAYGDEHQLCGICCGADVVVTTHGSRVIVWVRSRHRGRVAFHSTVVLQTGGRGSQSATITVAPSNRRSCSLTSVTTTDVDVDLSAFASAANAARVKLKLETNWTIAHQLTELLVGI